jgi:hypothetical protein
MNAEDPVPRTDEAYTAIRQPSIIGIAIVKAGPMTIYAGFCFNCFGAGGPSISTGELKIEGRFLGERL